MNALEGKRALVTGAAAGIGRAVATALSAEGARVATLDRNESKRDFELSLIADVSKEADVLTAFKTIDAEFGGLDLLVQCAGIQVIEPLLDMSAEQFDRVMDVNVKGVFLVGREAMRRMHAAGSGCLINIASELAYLGRSRYSVYCASKGAVLSMTRSWAREFAPHIRVNAVAPGPIDTQMVSLDCMTAEEIEAELSELPLRRIGQPEEVAATVVFLAGPGGRYYTGQCLGPNGGAVMT